MKRVAIVLLSIALAGALFQAWVWHTTATGYEKLYWESTVELEQCREVFRKWLEHLEKYPIGRRILQAGCQISPRTRGTV